MIRDGGIRGMVVCLAAPCFSRIELDGERLRAGAGARLKNLAVEARRNNLAGLEFLEGIPGSVGGALRMNAGAMGGAMFDVVESIRFMDAAGNVGEKTVSELSAQYRSCSFLKNHIALGGGFEGARLDAGGDCRADGRLQPEALGFAAGPAQRGMHF